MFDFVRNRRLFYLLSALLIVPGVISLILPGGLNPGIDFTSGTIMTIQFDQPVDQNRLREEFAQIGHSEAIVQQSSACPGTGRRYRRPRQLRTSADRASAHRDLRAAADPGTRPGLAADRRA